MERSEEVRRLSDAHALYRAHGENLEFKTRWILTETYIRYHYNIAGDANTALQIYLISSEQG